jgi:hypothetical protein
MRVTINQHGGPDMATAAPHTLVRAEPYPRWNIEGRQIIRSGPLNWPQEAQWVHMSFRRLDDSYYAAFRNGFEVRQRVTVPAAQEAMRRIIQDHEILRTIFAFAPGGTAVQHVLDGLDFSARVFPLKVLEEHVNVPPPPFTDGAPTGIPLWIADFYTEGDLVRAVLVTAEHIVFDGAGLENWKDQFHALARGEQHRRGRFRHPLDHRENVDSGQRRLPSGALAERRRIAERRRPQIVVPAVERVRGPRFIYSEGAFADLLTTVDAIAGQHTSSRPTVIMFLVGLLLAHHARQSVVRLCPLICDKPPHDASIECRMYAIDVELIFDGECRVGEQLSLIGASIMSAYADSTRSPMDAWEDAMASAAGRAGLTRRGPVFNFESTQDSGPAAGRDARRPGRDADTAATDCRVMDRWAEDDDPCGPGITARAQGDHISLDFGERDAVPPPARRDDRRGDGAPGGVSVTDWWEEDDEPYAACITARVKDGRLSIEYGVDATMHSFDTVHQMLACLPLLAAEILAHPDRRIDELVSTPEVGQFCNDGMIRVGPDWVSLAAVQKVLSGLPGVRGASVRAQRRQAAGDEDGTGEELVVAEIVSDGTVDGEALHAGVIERLWDRSDIVAPRRYLITMDGQLGQATAFEPGVSQEPRGPETPADLALATAFETANGHRAADFGVPYFLAGGRLACVPMLIESLLAQGYSGLQPRHILAPFTLRYMASCLRRENLQAGS